MKWKLFNRLKKFSQLILFNKIKELFEIREELKKSGLTLFNRKVLNSNKSLQNPSSSEFGLYEQPRPMMFVCGHGFIFRNYFQLI